MGVYHVHSTEPQSKQTPHLTGLAFLGERGVERLPLWLQTWTSLLLMMLCSFRFAASPGSRSELRWQTHRGQSSVFIFLFVPYMTHFHQQRLRSTVRRSLWYVHTTSSPCFCGGGSEWCLWPVGAMIPWIIKHPSELLQFVDLQSYVQIHRWHLVHLGSPLTSDVPVSHDSAGANASIFFIQIRKQNVKLFIISQDFTFRFDFPEIIQMEPN